MAVTKTFSAVPHSKSSKVERWDFSAKYENDSEGDATYYTSTFLETVESINPQGGTAFTKKDKDEWTLSEITAIMPLDHWDSIFASQYDSVITNPPVKSEPDQDFELPSA